MSFIATANPPAANTEAIVENDGFWPDIDREQLRKDIRLDGTVTPERLHIALLAAMWQINAELAPWKTEQTESGYTTLADVPAQTYGGKTIKEHQYTRAIYSHIQAHLAEGYRDMDTLPQGSGKEPRVLAAVEIRVDGFNQQMRWAIADLQGTSRVIVDLL